MLATAMPAHLWPRIQDPKLEAVVCELGTSRLVASKTFSDFPHHATAPLLTTLEL
eukprot:SAG11_NODE_1319_length_5209_cov_10.314873_6_plen_55_part_00